MAPGSYLPPYPFPRNARLIIITSPHQIMKATITLSFGLALLGLTASQTTDTFCGLGRTCPYDAHCVPLAPSCKDLNICGGRCWFKNDYPLCGPHIGGCPRGFECGRDPRKRKKGQAQPGICIPNDRSAYPMCGGIANIQCPEDKYCYDNPWDSCDPMKGGADCSGICI